MLFHKKDDLFYWIDINHSDLQVIFFLEYVKNFGIQDKEKICNDCDM